MSEINVKLYSDNGLTIGCRDEGSGPVVAVFSGWGYGSLMGEVQLATLRERGFRVITFDVPGTGELKDNSSFVYIPRIARLAAKYLREHDGTDATIVGHSFGSMVAQEMAMTEDDVAGRLVLASVVPGVGGMMPDLQSSMEMLNRLLSGSDGMMTFLFSNQYLANIKETLGNVFEELDKPTSSSALSGQVWAASRWNNFGRAHQIYQPTLIIHGRDDPISSIQNARILDTQLPDSTLVEMTGCGYLPLIECKEKVLQAILDFTGNPQKSNASAAKSA